VTDEAIVPFIQNIVMPSIERLELSWNTIGDRSVKALCSRNFTRLVDLRLRTVVLIVEWLDITNDGFKHIVNRLPWLKQLHFTGNNITYEALHGCRPEFFENIEVLDLSNNMLGDNFIKGLSELQPRMEHLKVISITWNDLTDAMGEYIHSMKLPWVEKFVVKSGNNLSQHAINIIYDVLNTSER
jgi:Ran GTPase-activating protein (RanGAP) involved in mRNA processing and transport